MEKFSKKQKREYIIVGIMTIAVLILGIVTNRVEFYFGFTVGAVASMIIMYMLTREIYNLVYIKNETRKRGFGGTLQRLAVAVLALFVVSYISKKYFVNKVSLNIIMTGLGLMSFKIAIYIEGKLFSKEKGNKKNITN